MISEGRYAFEPIEFSAIARVQVTFTFRPSSTMPLKAANTAEAPPLSMNISSIDPYGLTCRPPESKVSPLPTSAWISSELLLFMKVRLMRIGGFEDARPTAWCSSSPSFTRSSPSKNCRLT